MDLSGGGLDVDTQTGRLNILPAEKDVIFATPHLFLLWLSSFFFVIQECHIAYNKAFEHHLYFTSRLSCCRYLHHKRPQDTSGPLRWKCPSLENKQHIINTTHKVSFSLSSFACLFPSLVARSLVCLLLMFAGFLHNICFYEARLSCFLCCWVKKSFSRGNNAVTCTLNSLLAKGRRPVLALR